MSFFSPSLRAAASRRRPHKSAASIEMLCVACALLMTTLSTGPPPPMFYHLEAIIEYHGWYNCRFAFGRDAPEGRTHTHTHRFSGQAGTAGTDWAGTARDGVPEVYFSTTTTHALHTR